MPYSLDVNMDTIMIIISLYLSTYIWVTNKYHTANISNCYFSFVFNVGLTSTATNTSDDNNIHENPVAKLWNNDRWSFECSQNTWNQVRVQDKTTYRHKPLEETVSETFSLPTSLFNMSLSGIHSPYGLEDGERYTTIYKRRPKKCRVTIGSLV